MGRGGSRRRCLNNLVIVEKERERGRRIFLSLLFFIILFRDVYIDASARS